MSGSFVKKIWQHVATSFIVSLMIAMPISYAVAGQGDAWEQRRTQCTGWMLSGYPSGLAEKSCSADFGLPSPFLFVCAQAQNKGFESESQRSACGLFFAKASAAAENGVVKN